MYYLYVNYSWPNGKTNIRLIFFNGPMATLFYSTFNTGHRSQSLHNFDLFLDFSGGICFLSISFCVYRYRYIKDYLLCIIELSHPSRFQIPPPPPPLDICNGQIHFKIKGGYSIYLSIFHLNSSFLQSNICLK